MQPKHGRPEDVKLSQQADIKRVEARAYKIPTEIPETDGTLEWNSTTLVVVHVNGGGQTGIGYTYASEAAAPLIKASLAPVIVGENLFDIPKCHHKLLVSLRNIGTSGVGACAVSAIDCALWDLKAKIVNQPLVGLLGALRDAIPAYGSGGFTNWGPARIAKSIDDWRAEGLQMFKIKIGRNRKDDMARIAEAIRHLPDRGKLFVDANGAYQVKEALMFADQMAKDGITWFEEPVSSADEAGLRFVRQRAPHAMDIAAGEYGFGLDDLHRLLKAEAVDVLQADVTRCLGITGFLKASALAQAYQREISSHCAPALHTALMCHIPNGRHLEYFSDHVRIEKMLFDGVPALTEGSLQPQEDRAGFGFEFKQADAEKFAL